MLVLADSTLNLFQIEVQALFITRSNILKVLFYKVGSSFISPYSDFLLHFLADKCNFLFRATSNRYGFNFASTS